MREEKEEGCETDSVKRSKSHVTVQEGKREREREEQKERNEDRINSTFSKGEKREHDSRKQEQRATDSRVSQQRSIDSRREEQRVTHEHREEKQRASGEPHMRGESALNSQTKASRANGSHMKGESAPDSQASASRANGSHEEQHRASEQRASEATVRDQRGAVSSEKKEEKRKGSQPITEISLHVSAFPLVDVCESVSYTQFLSCLLLTEISLSCSLCCPLIPLFPPPTHCIYMCVYTRFQ